MRVVRDFKCTEGHVTKDKLVHSNVNFILCNICGNSAKRLISASSFKVNGDGAYDSGKFKGRS